jgi:tight adherence protein B
VLSAGALAVGACCCAAALLCWPPARARSQARAGVHRARRVARIPRPGTAALVAASVAVGWLLFGALAAVACGLATFTALNRWRARGRRRRTVTAMTNLAEALLCLVGELRAGAHPALAAESTAADARSPGREVMTAIAATERLGGDVEVALDRTAGQHPELTAELRGLAGAWQLATRHGLPLAEVLAAVHRDLEHRLRFAGQVHAKMAGPRSSALVLAALPAVGVLLGEAMGAQPLHVLLHTGLGSAMLLLGVGLTCAGIALTARLTSGVALK